MLTRLLTRAKMPVFEIFKESGRVYLTLLKILVPALVIVKSLEMLGFTLWLGAVLAPLMGWLGLPETVSIVWAATLLTNIYTGMVLFFEVARTEALTVAQVSVLGTLQINFGLNAIHDSPCRPTPINSSRRTQQRDVLGRLLSLRDSPH
ncbi:hypothetical protein [Marinobacter salicampi]|uniref:hypothetical protein n=1 Tax=Marinobacter salicampi TaxID=435907 RepID=UPI001A93EBA3|nr:hypothetical protein [Marinobacter salicampi]